MELSAGQSSELLVCEVWTIGNPTQSGITFVYVAFGAAGPADWSQFKHDSHILHLTLGIMIT
jgi:hypothetical protein